MRVQSQAIWMGVCLWAASAAAAGGDSADRAADAAERAAAAAERSAAAAEKAAAILEQSLRPMLPPLPPGEAPPGVAAPAPAAAKPPPWSFTGGLGLISLTGNVRTITFTANAAAQYKNKDWILSLKGAGAYGQNNPPGGGAAQILALQALFAAQADYRFSHWISGYLGAGADTDHVKSVEARGYGEIGAGFIWIDHKDGDLQRTFLTTDLGFRYQREARFQYFPTVMDVPDVDLLAPRVAGSFRYALNKEVLFQQDVEVLPNVLGPSRVLVNTNTKISAKLVSAFAISVNFAVKYDSRPAIGRIPTDTALTIGLDVNL